MFEFNKDHEARNKILGITGEDNGDIIHFDHLTLDGLEELIEKKFADSEEAQNSSPIIQEMLDFMKSHPDFTAHGYAVSIKRSDYRVSLEGITLNRKPTYDELIDFVDCFRFADDFNCGESGCNCWYD